MQLGIQDSIQLLQFPIAVHLAKLLFRFEQAGGGPAGDVVRARRVQLERFATEKKIYANAQMPPKLIRKHCDISAEGEKLLENAITRMGLSARAHDRILKVARTIADLHGAADVEPSHLGEAVQYRSLDRTYLA